MNEYVLYTLAQVATTLAGFSGLVVVFRVRGAHAWARAELRIFWFLLGDSFLVLFFSLLPIPMALASWSQDAVWSLCNALLGSWFVVGNVLALLGELKDRALEKPTIVAVITPALFGMSIMIAPLMAIVLWLSAFDFIVRRGQAIFVFGLIVLLMYAALEFLFFIGLMSQKSRQASARAEVGNLD